MWYLYSILYIRWILITLITENYYFLFKEIAAYRGVYKGRVGDTRATWSYNWSGQKFDLNRLLLYNWLVDDGITLNNPFVIVYTLYGIYSILYKTGIVCWIWKINTFQKILGIPNVPSFQYYQSLKIPKGQSESVYRRRSLKFLFILTKFL